MSAEKIVDFPRVDSSSPKCGRCAHVLGNAHDGKPCMVPIVINGVEKVCPCAAGVRADVFLCMQVSELIQGIRSIDQQINQMRMLAIANGNFEIVENEIDHTWRIQQKLMVRP